MSRYDQHSREKQSRARATIILGLSERREVEAIMGTLSKSTLNEKCFAYLSTKTLRLPQFESRFNGATEAKKYFSFTVPEITVSIYDIINSVSKYTRVRPTVQRRIEYFLQMFLPRNGWPTNGKVIKYTLEENKLNSSGLDLSTNRSNTSSRKMNIEAIDEHVEMLKATFSQYIDKLNQEMLTFQSKYGTKIRSASIATSSPQDTGRSSAFRLHPRSHQGSGIVNVLADGAATTSTTGMKRIIDGENQQGLIIQTLRPLMRVVDNNGDDSDLCHQEGETTSPSPNDASSFSSLSKSGSRTPQSSGQNASGSLPGTLKRNVSEDTLSLVSQCVPANIFSPGFIRAFTQKYILPHMIGRHHEIFACSARRWGRSNTPNHTCVSLPQLSTDKTSGMKNSTSKAHSHSSQTLSKAPSLHRPTIPSSNRAHITHSTSPRAIDAADEHTERIAAIIGTKTGFFMASDANSWVSLCDEILEPLSQLLLVRHCNHIQNNRGCQSDGGGVRSSGGKRRTPSTAYTSDSTVYHSYPCNTTQELHVRQKSELAAAYHRILTTVVPPHLQHLRQLYIDSMDPFELLMVTSVCGLCPSGSFQAALTTAVDSLKFHLQASLIAEGNSGLSFTGQYGNNNVRDLSSPIGTSSPTSVSTLASMLSTQSQTAISNSHQRNGPRLPSVKIIPVEAARSICFGVPILMHFFEHIATW